MSGKVIIQNKRRILDDFFKVDEAEVSYERFDGSMGPPARRLSLERGDSVAALIFNRERQSIILVNQFRFPAYEKGPGWLIEVAAGILEQGEAVEDAVCREVLEETGYQIEVMEPISSFYVSPGGSSERILLYYAEVCDEGRREPGGGLAGENEDIRIEEIPLSELDDLISGNQIQDAKTLIGLLWLKGRMAYKASKTSCRQDREGDR